MNEMLAKSLRDSERVLWEGSPKKIELFEKPYAKILGIRWSICAAVVLVALYYWLVYPTVATIDASRARNISLMIIAGCALVSVLPIMTLSKIQKVVKYAITNERIICYKTNNDVVTYRDLNDITEVTVYPLNTGRYNLFVGEVTDKIRKRVHDDIFPYREENRMEPMVLASIGDADKAVSFLPGHIVVHNLEGEKAKA